jgi:hypothetical protein
MRYLFLFFILVSTIYSEEKKELSKDEKMIVLPMPEGSQSVMMIDSKARALDFIKAYDILKREKVSARIFFKLSNGQMITNIIDLSLLEQNTLILFKLTALQGMKYSIIPIEQIKEIGTL